MWNRRATPLLESDLVLLATWKAAVDIEDQPERQQPEEEEPEVPPGSGSVAAAVEEGSAA